jgi:hypothetical protein
MTNPRRYVVLDAFTAKVERDLQIASEKSLFYAQVY